MWKYQLQDQNEFVNTAMAKQWGSDSIQQISRIAKKKTFNETSSIESGWNVFPKKWNHKWEKQMFSIFNDKVAMIWKQVLPFFSRLGQLPLKLKLLTANVRYVYFQVSLNESRKPKALKLDLSRSKKCEALAEVANKLQRD